MTSKLKCPFCGEEIKIAGERTTIMSCFNGECCGSGLYGEEAMWQALIQTKQDLKTATKALENISGIRENIEDYYGGVSIHYQQMVLHMDEIATNALEQIKHKE